MVYLNKPSTYLHQVATKNPAEAEDMLYAAEEKMKVMMCTVRLSMQPAVLRDFVNFVVGLTFCHFFY